MNSAATDSATWKRLAEVQASPMFRILARTAPSTAWSRSASSNTRKGALPPSSIEVWTTPSAAFASRALPTPVDPVKESLRRRGSPRIGSTTVDADDDVTTLSTPLGRPTSSRMSVRASIDSGVSCAGFTTIVHPAAMAGPILRVPMAMGKFHGVMSRQGPTGWRIVRRRPLPLGTIANRPSMRTASSANQRRNSAA